MKPLHKHSLKPEQGSMESSAETIQQNDKDTSLHDWQEGWMRG